MKHDVVRHLKVYALHTVGDRQAPAVHHPLNKCRHAVNIDILRAVSRQSHNNRDIGGMTFTGQRQRTIQVDHDARDRGDVAHAHQLVDKTFSGIHRPYGVRTGRTNAGFKISNALIISPSSGCRCVENRSHRNWTAGQNRFAPPPLPQRSRTAMASISSFTSFGRRATCTQLRVG